MAFPTRSTILPLLIGAWTIVGASLLLTHAWRVEVSFILSILVGLLGVVLLPLVGLALFAVCWLKRPFRWRSAIALIASAWALIWMPLGSWGYSIWSWISLRQHRAAYEAIISEVHAIPVSGRLHGERYVIDYGPPTRVFFPRAHGIPDGQGGVVHDPSGQIMKDAIQASPSALHDRFIFNDNVQHCIHIEGPWYRCWFDW